MFAISGIRIFRPGVVRFPTCRHKAEGGLRDACTAGLVGKKHGTKPCFTFEEAHGWFLPAMGDVPILPGLIFEMGRGVVGARRASP
jgi:hypothetical protein